MFRLELDELLGYCGEIRQRVLLSCLVTELQKPSAPGLEPRTHFFRCCGLSCYNLLAETGSFGCGAILVFSFRDTEKLPY